MEGGRVGGGRDRKRGEADGEAADEGGGVVSGVRNCLP